MWIKKSHGYAVSILKKRLVWMALAIVLGISVGTYAKKLEQGYFWVEEWLTNVYLTKVLHVDIPTIEIDIPFKELRKLQYKRAKVLAFQHPKNVLMATDEDEVSAKLRYEQESFKVQMRLKGDWMDHLTGQKWSFRIKLKKDKQVEGMQQFSLQSYQRRGRIMEWFYLNVLKDIEIIAPRYFLVHAYMNGRYLGLYVIEETFDKGLVESNSFRESVIVKFDEDQLWEKRFLDVVSDKGLSTSYMDDFPSRGQDAAPLVLDSGHVLSWEDYFFYRNSVLMPFKLSYTYENPALFGQFKRIHQLLQEYRKGQREPKDVFDLDKMAQYLALNHVFGAYHSHYWHNMRMYYNPITAKLEPIGFDGDTHGIVYDEASQKMVITNELYLRMLEDSVFEGLYVKWLKDYARLESIEPLIRHVEEETDIFYYSTPVYSWVSAPLFSIPMIPSKIKYRNMKYILRHNIQFIHSKILDN